MTRVSNALKVGQGKPHRAGMHIPCGCGRTFSWVYSHQMHDKVPSKESMNMFYGYILWTEERLNMLYK